MVDFKTLLDDLVYDIEAYEEEGESRNAVAGLLKTYATSVETGEYDD